jgi:hypothetical protein
LSLLPEAGITGTAPRAFADLLPDTRREAASMIILLAVEHAYQDESK